MFEVAGALKCKTHTQAHAHIHSTYNLLASSACSVKGGLREHTTQEGGDGPVVRPSSEAFVAGKTALPHGGACFVPVCKPNEVVNRKQKPNETKQLFVYYAGFKRGGRAQ